MEKEGKGRERKRKAKKATLLYKKHISTQETTLPLVEPKEGKKTEEDQRCKIYAAVMTKSDPK